MRGVADMNRQRCRLPVLVWGVALALVLAVAPYAAQARVGGGISSGSRGTRTYSAPPPTTTAPGVAAPLGAPSYGTPGYGAPGYGAPGYGRPSFMRGFMGGMVGAGLLGLFLGHGFFWGMHGPGGLIGVLVQILLIVLVVRWALRFFTGAGRLNQSMAPGMGGAPAGAGASVPLAILPEDYRQFEAALIQIQAAWSAADIAALRRLTTPEMAAVFIAQGRDLQARGLRNEVSDVRLQQGDLAEAWREGGADYATVAMRFSMIDVTRDAAGHVVEGAPGEHVEATELWTFTRPQGGNWVLSAIQQTR